MPWHKLYRDQDVPLPLMPLDFETLQVHINKVQNRYKRFDRGLDLARMQVLRAYYYACVSFIDYQVGRILKALEGNNQLENTLIIFTSDHGELLGDYGCVGKRSFHDAASRIPMILRGPGIPANQRNATPVDLVDATKTILSAADATPSTHVCEGIDLAAQSRAGEVERVIFTQYQRDENAVYTAVHNDWKYAYSAPDDREFLFNRLRDPLETRNLPFVGAPIHTAKPGRELRSALLDFLKTHGHETPIESDESGSPHWRKFPRKEFSENPNEGLIYQDHAWADLHIPGYSR